MCSFECLLPLSVEPPTPLSLILIVFHSFSVFLSSLHFRCSSCFCLVDKASSGFRNGTCLCLIRRKRRSPESWCRRSWLESPKCAAFWSGETSRLYIRGGYWVGTCLWIYDLWLNAHRKEYFTLPWAIHRPIIHTHGSVGEAGESVIKVTKASGLHSDCNEKEHSFCFIIFCCRANGHAGGLLVNPGDPTGTGKHSTWGVDESGTLHHCTTNTLIVFHLSKTINGLVLHPMKA